MGDAKPQQRHAIATVGRPAPEFTASTSSGDTVRLSDLRGRKVILFFYPKDSTPGCTRQACAFRDLAEQFERVNAVVFGVNPGGAESHRKFRERQALPFELLVDEGHTIASAYGVWQEKSLYGRRFFGVVRSHFLVDEEGVLAEARVPASPDEGPREALAAARDHERTRRARDQEASPRAEATGGSGEPKTRRAI